MKFLKFYDNYNEVNLDRFYDFLNYIPSKTMFVYKLMRLPMTKKDFGTVQPLYAKSGSVRKSYLLGKWFTSSIDTVVIAMKTLAFRPGIHSIELPIFSQGKGRVSSGRRAWVLWEIPVYNESTQKESDESKFLKNNTRGMRVGVTRQLRPDECYNYRTNNNAFGGEGWPISGSGKPVRVLSDNEVRDILSKHNKTSHISNSLTGIDEAFAKRINEAGDELSQKISGINETY